VICKSQGTAWFTYLCRKRQQYYLIFSNHRNLIWLRHLPMFTKISMDLHLVDFIDKAQLTGMGAVEGATDFEFH
jgi:hypothetical protein